MARIFISYSRNDVEFARKLAQSLSEMGEDIWIDVEDIPAGMNWSSAIQQGLHICDAMLVILSPDSVSSSNVADEWQYYHDQRKPIIPVLWKPAEVHYQLRRIQYIDFHTQNYETALKQLQTAIQNRDAPRPATPHTPSPAPAPRERRLEAAMPQQTKVATPTEVWVKVTLAGAAGLRAELPASVASGDVIQQDDVRGSTFPITFPAEDGRLLPINVCVQVRCNGFRVQAEADDSGECDEGQVALELHPDYDSRTVIFELLPRSSQTLGRARITISLFHDGNLVGQTSVSTEIVQAVASGIPWNFLATPLAYATPMPPGVALAPGDTTLVGEQTFPLPPSAMPRTRAAPVSSTLISALTLVTLVVLGGVLLFRWVNAPMLNASESATETAVALIPATDADTLTLLAVATEMATATVTPAPSATPSLTPTAIPTATPQHPVFVAYLENAPVRFQPDSTSQGLEVGSNQNFPITGISADGDYYRVEVNGQEGWVHISFGRIEGNLTGIPIIPMFNIFIDSAPLRSEPNSTSETVAIVRNERLPILGINPAQDYYCIRFEGRVGWIRASLGTVEGSLGTVPVVENGNNC
jgi:hypothetical protein